jgi:hypothetical protein
MPLLLQRTKTTTVIVPHVSEHACAKDVLAFYCDLLIKGPAKGLTGGSSHSCTWLARSRLMAETTACSIVLPATTMPWLTR